MRHDYSNIPFKYNGRDFEGCDCWGLVRLVFKHELGIELPSYLHIEASELTHVAKAIKSQSDASQGWSDIEGHPQAFDVVAMNANIRCIDGKRRTLPTHVGVMVDSYKVLHIERGINSIVQRLKCPTIKPRIVKICRYGSNSNSLASTV